MHNTFLGHPTNTSFFRYTDNNGILRLNNAAHDVMATNGVDAIGQCTCENPAALLTRAQTKDTRDLCDQLLTYLGQYLLHNKPALANNHMLHPVELASTATLRIALHSEANPSYSAVHATVSGSQHVMTLTGNEWSVTVPNVPTDQGLLEVKVISTPPAGGATELLHTLSYEPLGAFPVEPIFLGYS